MAPEKSLLPEAAIKSTQNGHPEIGEGLVLLSRAALEQDVRAYVGDIVSSFAARVTPNAPVVRGDSLADEIFLTLTDRQFCHLSRARTEPYRERALETLEEHLRSGSPIPFSYDVGPGYHASVRPGDLELNFAVGMSELFVLFQVASFCGRVAMLYPPGARFWLVVDNLCALRTNDIPIERTLGYCAQFRTLIKELGLSNRVAMLVESEQCDIDTYDRLLSEVEGQPPASLISAAAIENVDRFVGRRCDATEAAERIERYRRAGIATELLLARVARGVRMTQRATETTLGFRAVPGGDSRLQCGEVVISRNSKGKLHPILLTSRNVDRYTCTHVAPPDGLPSLISRLTYAEPL